MRTKYKIFLTVSLSTILFFGAYQVFMYQCGTIPVFAETPRNPNFWNCLTVYQNQHYVHSDDVYAVHVETDKQEYHTNDVVIISGYVDNIGSNTNLTITIYNPLLEVVSILQVAISDDNTFEESLPIGGSLWEQNGIYSISVQYGKAADHTDFLYLSDLESDGLL